MLSNIKHLNYVNVRYCTDNPGTELLQCDFLLQPVLLQAVFYPSCEVSPHFLLNHSKSLSKKSAFMFHSEFLSP